MTGSFGLERRAGLGGIAAAGILLSHWLAYVLVAPDPHARSSMLEATGHRYFALVAAALIGAAVMGVSGTVLETLRRPGRLAGEAPALLLLTLAQVVGFAMLEVLERLMADGPAALGGLAAEPAFLIGLALQVLVAAVNLRLLKGLIGTIAAIARRRRYRDRALSTPVSRPISVAFAPCNPCSGAAGLRSPPVRA